MARYFIGLMAPPRVQAHLTAVMETIQTALPADHPYKVAWNHPADLHCTLLFIGSYDDEHYLTQRLADITQRLAPITLTLEGSTHWLGRNSLAIGVSGADHTGRTVIRQLGKLSSDRWAGRRPFHGHMTIARVRPVPEGHSDPFGGREIQPVSWCAKHIQLVRSRDRTSDLKYEIVAQLPLGETAT